MHLARHDARSGGAVPRHHDATGAAAGETSKGQLLQQFVSAGNALLVATSSFWEGVDVRGDALSLVIIDKLPFTSPDDPLLKARMEDCRCAAAIPSMKCSSRMR
ncbi:bifunctional ATP-dependent DNA helicase/DNA polymerase III subunit epsilon [Serratia liquefaciens]|nr:bifunctional ATP-dependent DNA helicase/DNA polymerase III subunit epsilon [Serratia liquefaciens]